LGGTICFVEANCLINITNV